MLGGVTCMGVGDIGGDGAVGGGQWSRDNGT